MANVVFTFEWTPEMSVGDAALDAQHERLLAEVNALLSAIVYRQGKDMVGKTLGFLETYIMEHLRDEEAYMQAHEYPDFEAHRRLHAGFISHFTQLKQKAETEGASDALALAVQTHIGEWWIHHIGTEDHKYAMYVAKHPPLSVKS